MAVENDLMSQVARKLRVTWNDADTDALIRYDIIPSAEAVLTERIGIPADKKFDFSTPGIENELFLSLCFYKWNDAEDEFYANYEARIAEARRKWEVLQYVEETEQTPDV